MNGGDDCPILSLIPRLGSHVLVKLHVAEYYTGHEKNCTRTAEIIHLITYNSYCNICTFNFLFHTIKNKSLPKSPGISYAEATYMPSAL